MNQSEEIKSAEAIIRGIQVNAANLDHIKSTGVINGSLSIDIINAMHEYANQSPYQPHPKYKQ